MSETVRSYDCGCDFGEDFAHLCRTAANLEADQHFAESDVWGAITGAQHLIDDANRDEWAEVIGIGSSHDMRGAAKHLREISAELERQANRYEKALASEARYRGQLNAHLAASTYTDVEIQPPPVEDV